MARSKHGKPSEFYEEQIKTLRSLNKALKKRLRQLEKNNFVREELKLDKEADEEVERDKFLVPEATQYEVCPNCSRRGIEDIVIYDRLFHTCIHCKYRSKAIIIGIPK